MSLNKDEFNCVIALDLQCKKVRVLKFKGVSYDDFEFREIEIAEHLTKSNKIFEILNIVLIDLLDTDFIDVKTNMYVVLPDNLISIDHTKLPVMSKLKIKDALKTELKTNYFNYDLLEKNSTILRKNKRNITFNTVFVQKYIVEEVVKAFKKYELSLKIVTYMANALQSSIIELSSKLRHQNYLFVDLRKKYTRIIVSGKDKLFGFHNLPFGLEVMANDRVFCETYLFAHSTAKEAVTYAQESARAKQGNYATEKGNELIDDEEGEDAKNFNSKQLQKFIQYSTPRSEEDYLCENFKTILKQILLIYKAGTENPTIPKLQYCVFNLPKRLTFIVDGLNGDDEKPLEYRTFSQELHGNSVLAKNLDMYGAIFCGKYNKGHNFVNKEESEYWGKLKLWFQKLINK